MTWLGWTSISDEEIRAAERAADLDEQDVRDELGLSFLHFLYADRFFPGTSTQMTKLRYVLFVAAAYERLRQEARDGAPDELLPGLEWDIAVQLKEAVENAGQSLTRSGVIGWTVVDRSSRSGRGKVPKVLPSMSYFTALAHWQIFDRRDRWPVRPVMHADWKIYTRRTLRGGDVENERRNLFCSELEEKWQEGLQSTHSLKDLGELGRPLGFDLDRWEVDFLRERMSSVVRPGSNAPALLARVANSKSGLLGLVRAPNFWEADFERLVSDDDAEAKALVRAKATSALMHVCNAAYVVLVARRCRDRDKVSRAKEVVDRAEAALSQLRSGYEAKLVAELQPETVLMDREASGPVRAGNLFKFLEEAKQWMKSGKDIRHLEHSFAVREAQAKGASLRARLCEAKDLRSEWIARRIKDVDSDRPLTRPPDFRWGIASSLLSELTVKPTK
ncbi:hypothetical protein I6F20_32635 [Bradyrhizobium sp. IC3123]|uniref:DUF6361 family protein n=1 Tax=Bradyrhizobium sp. IC3123 TaxID=2793803 RepID=UPI001CD5A1EC|nr:hypothetical protein [Bradyrhizobium sp. IC3123]